MARDRTLAMLFAAKVAFVLAALCAALLTAAISYGQDERHLIIPGSAIETLSIHFKGSPPPLPTPQSTPSPKPHPAACRGVSLDQEIGRETFGLREIRLREGESQTFCSRQPVALNRLLFRISKFCGDATVAEGYFTDPLGNTVKSTSGKNYTPAVAGDYKVVLVGAQGSPACGNLIVVSLYYTRN